MISTGQIKTEEDLPQLPKELTEYTLPSDFRTGQPSVQVTTAMPPKGATRTKQPAKKTKIAPKKPLPKPTPVKGKGKEKAKAKEDEGVDALEAIEEESSGTHSIHGSDEHFADSEASD